MKNMKKAIIIMTAAAGIFTGIMGANAADGTAAPAAKPAVSVFTTENEPAIITKVKKTNPQDPFIKLDDRNFLNAASYQKVKSDLKDTKGNTIKVKDKYMIEIFHILTKDEAAKLAANTKNDKIKNAGAVRTAYFVITDNDGKVSATPVYLKFEEGDETKGYKDMEGTFMINNPKADPNMSKAFAEINKYFETAK